MADSKITEMAEITSYDDNVITPVVVSENGQFVNKMIRLKNIKGRDYIAGNGINIINDVISTNDSEINKQDPLVSGVNIKTINGMTLLGSGNITVEGGGTGGEVYVSGYGINISEGNAINVDTNELNNIYQAKMGSDDNYVTDLEKTKLSNLSGINTGDQDLSGLLPKTDAALIYQVKMGSDDNYVTDAEKIKLLNLSGTNSGDETESTIKTKLGITTLSGANTGDETTSTIKTKLGITTLSGVNTGDQDLTPYLTKVEAGSTYQPLMGPDDNYMTDAEKIKLSNLSGDQDLTAYLTKVEAGNTYQIKMGSDDNYVTNDEKTKLLNLSGTNTGDQDLTPYLTIANASTTYQPLMGIDDNYVTDAEKVKLSNLSGVNTGDQDLSGLLSKTDADLIYQSKMGIDDNYVTDDEKVKLNNLSGVNTGDQDLTPYLTKVEASNDYQTKMGIDDNYVTNDEKTKLSNLSGVNTGDETESTIKTKLGITTLSGSNTGDQDLTPYLTKIEAGNTYLTAETDPIFNASVAKTIVTDDITNWNNKVSKIAGKSLISDTEIDKLSDYPILDGSVTKYLRADGTLAEISGGTGGEVYVPGYAISITEGNSINVDTNELNNVYQPLMGSDDNYVTDDEKVKLSNLSGVNTGDQDLTPYLTIANASTTYQPIMGTDDNYVTDDEKLKLSNLSGVNTGDQDLTPYLTIVEAGNEYQTKMGSDDNYVTDDEKLKLSNLSGVNTGDETESSIKTKLGITTLSGVNTGDQDLTPYLSKNDAALTYQPLMGSDDNYMTDAEKIKLSNLSGDQDLTDYLTKTEAGNTYQVKMGSDDNYVTDEEKTKLSNLSGVNSGDQDLSALSTYNYVDATFAPKTRTISAGAGLSGGGSLSGNITLSHADTSSASGISSTNTDTRVLQSLVIGVDTYGHVTATSLSSVDLSQTLVLKSDFTGHTHTGAYVPITIPNAIAATTYTFVIGDAYKLISFGSSSATSVTVPTNSSVAFAIGTQIDCYQAGTGAVTFVGASGVTINSLDNNKTINGQYVGVSLIKTATNSWLLVGNLKA